MPRRLSLKDILIPNQDNPPILAKILTPIFKKLGFTILKTMPVIPSYVFDTLPKIRVPRYDYVRLMDEAQRSWILRLIFRSIIGEVITPQWTIQPKFKQKCRACGLEFQSLTETCPCGSKDFRTPNIDEYQLVKALTTCPNPDYNFEEFLRATLWYALALDDYYWYITYEYLQDGTRRPKYVTVADARFIFPVADRFGRLGGYEYFCPNCYKPDADTFIDIRKQPKQLRCPDCKGELIQTAYVQRVQGKIIARFGKHEIVHGSLSRILPSLFGNPKIVTLWKIIKTIDAMDDYNWEVYSEGKVGSIIVFPKADQDRITEMKTRIEEEISKLEAPDIQTGRFKESKKIKQLFIGSPEPPIRVRIMEDLTAMQSIEFYKLYITCACLVYGVMLVFAVIQPGRRKPQLIIDVQNRVTREYQRSLENTFNLGLLPIFGIHDWELRFNEIEPKDKLRAAQIEHTKAATALTYLQGGFNVSIDDNGNLIVTGEGQKFPRGEPKVQRSEEWQRGAPTSVRGTRLQTELEISESTGELIQRRD